MTNLPSTRSLRSRKPLILDLFLGKLGREHIVGPLFGTAGLELLGNGQAGLLLGQTEHARSAGGVDHALLDFAGGGAAVHEDEAAVAGVAVERVSGFGGGDCGVDVCGRDVGGDRVEEEGFGLDVDFLQ